MDLMAMGVSESEIMALVVQWGMSLVFAVATLIGGLFLAGIVGRVLGSVLDRAQVDPSLRSFLTSLTSIALKALVYITALSVLGVEMTSFVAILAAAGLAVGMALSGTLQNFAGGVIILLFKPYKVGDFIEAQGYSGSVKEIQIFITVLTTPDNKTVLIPNGPLSNGSLINYSTQPLRRVDWTFGIGYGDDLDKAYELVHSLLAADEKVLEDPAPFVALASLGDNSVNLVVRAWVKAPDYWEVHFRMNDQVYRQFAARGLSIPFPQLDVHLHEA
jgi:small conductance mechanosensitive channel